MADFVVDQYQRQIDKKQEVIDQYNAEIDDLEGQLDKEKELRDNGLANNVDTLQMGQCGSMNMSWTRQQMPSSKPQE